MVRQLGHRAKVKPEGERKNFAYLLIHVHYYDHRRRSVVQRAS